MIVDKVDPTKVTESLVSSYLDTSASKYPNPDIVIRSGKRSRLSGFLPWQATYSELVFSDAYCPDFDVECLKKCLQNFKANERTFGGN
jgi:undecaprenyl diphosphate synthase